MRLPVGWRSDLYLSYFMATQYIRRIDQHVASKPDRAAPIVNERELFLPDRIIQALPEKEICLGMEFLTARYVLCSQFEAIKIKPPPRLTQQGPNLNIKSGGLPNQLQTGEEECNLFCRSLRRI